MSGFARRLQQAVVVSQPPASGDRGRPTIVNNTLVSDQGTLLRGTALWLFPDNNPTQWSWSHNASAWPRFATYHLNTVRLAVGYGPSGSGSNYSYTLSQWQTELDNFVDTAAANNMYAVIDLHPAAGEYDMATAVPFWQAIAPRYADRTHVLYELTNEPVSWSSNDYTPQNLSDFHQLYTICHTAAPKTPIIVLTFPMPANDDSNSAPTMKDVADDFNALGGIDWTRTAVGYHTYWIHNSTGEAQLKASYPVINTEFQVPAGVNQETVAEDGDNYLTHTMEELGSSWLCWNINSTSGASSKADEMQSDAQTRGYWWPADS